MTSSARFASELLAARERRQEFLTEFLRRSPATLFFSLNIPGADKTPPGSARLFRWFREALREKLPALMEIRSGVDFLGPFSLLSGEYDALTAKLACLDLESSRPAGRLIDLDVYDRMGRPVDRNLLGIPQRICLLCNHPARECIRLQRHSFGELESAAHELLLPFLS